jgi:hypothetical protein
MINQNSGGNVFWGVFITILLHQYQIACRTVWEVSVEKGVMVDLLPV